jgi:hypothetical protein
VLGPRAGLNALEREESHCAEVEVRFLGIPARSVVPVPLRRSSCGG